MSVNCTWRVNDLTHKDADGAHLGLLVLRASRVPASEGDPVYSATVGGKLVMTYDASATGFIPYGSLTVIVVLGWVYADLAANSDVENETPDEAKARVENERVAKVWAQIERANSQSTGLLGSEFNRRLTDGER